MTVKRQSPAGTPGKEKNAETQSDHSKFMQAVQRCYPCTSCAYLRLVTLPAGGFRKVCSFTGNKLPCAGKPLCEFRQGGVHERN